MDWQLEGLTNQYLYDTVLFSLGFLQLSVADAPETVKQISLFAPVITEPMKVSDLARLSELETPEYVVELPFASELWQRVFAELNPPKNVLLEVWVEPEEDWIRSGGVRTSQQVGIPKENGETVFQDIWIRFSAVASFENVILGGYTRLSWIKDQELTMSEIEPIKKKIEELKKKTFENGREDEADRRSRESYEAELRGWDSVLKRAENTLAKLPAAYEELKQNESARFHYAVFLATGDGKRKLRVLTTNP
jgi:hypothetical protein